MANICTSTYTLVGNSLDCSRVKRQLERIKEEEDGDLRFLHAFIGDPRFSSFSDVEKVINQVTGPYTLVSAKPLPYQEGGDITHISAVEKYKGEYCIHFDSDDNWHPCRKLVLAFAKYNGLRANWMAAETGCGIVEKHDPDGVYEAYKWFVDSFLSPADFITEADLSIRYTFPDEFCDFLERNSIKLTPENIVTVAAAYRESIKEDNGDDGEASIYVFPVENV